MGQMVVRRGGRRKIGDRRFLTIGGDLISREEHLAMNLYKSGKS